MSASNPPPPDVASVAGPHEDPLYFKTCPAEGVVVSTSNKSAMFPTTGLFCNATIAAAFAASAFLAVIASDVIAFVLDIMSVSLAVTFTFNEASAFNARVLSTATALVTAVVNA